VNWFCSQATLLHSYEYHKQSIVNKLLSGGSEEGEVSSDQVVTSICVVGESGMGKTELVHQVFNDQMILDAFDMRIWVYIRDKKGLLGI